MVVAFEAEAREAAWARQMEDAIRRAVGKVSGLEATSLECKTTICRVEFPPPQVDSKKRPAAWVRMFVHELGREADMNKTARLTEEDLKAGATFIYFTRAGYREPQPDGTPRIWIDEVPDRSGH